MVPFRVPKKLFSNNALSTATARVTRRLEDLYIREKLGVDKIFLSLDVQLPHGFSTPSKIGGGRRHLRQDRVTAGPHSKGPLIS